MSQRVSHSPSGFATRTSQAPLVLLGMVAVMMVSDTV
jgi:hypothetical protein